MSKQNAYSLAIDQGSHSSRAIVFDDRGNALASASQMACNSNSLHGWREFKRHFN